MSDYNFLYTSDGSNFYDMNGVRAFGPPTNLGPITPTISPVDIKNFLPNTEVNLDTSGLADYKFTPKLSLGQRANGYLKSNPGVNMAVQAAANVVGNVANRAITDGFHGKAADMANTVLSTAGGLVGGAIGGPFGAALGTVAGNVLGGVTSRAIGYKTNDENIEAVKGNIAKQKAIGNQLQITNDNSTLVNAYNSASPLQFSRRDLGRDGWLSHKIKDMEKLFHNRQNYTTGLMNHGLVTGEKRANIMNDDLTKKYNTVTYAYGGLLDYMNDMPAVNYDFMNSYLTSRNERNNNSNKLTSPVAGLPNAFAIGGDLQTHGADWSTGSSHIDAGGTHEKNPNQGVQVGVDSQGTPNLVEEGEVIYNDYVYSQRITLDNEAKERFNISKKKELTYADEAKVLEKEISERPNDPISKAGYDAQMQALAEEQERQKAEMQAQEAQEMFAQLSPEEQVALMQQMAGGQQEAPVDEQQAAQEQMAQEQMVAEQGIPQETMMQGQPVMPQEGMVPGGMPMGNMGAYGGNLFALGGDGDKNAEMIRKILAVGNSNGTSSENFFDKVANSLGTVMDPVSLTMYLLDKVTAGKSTEAADKALDKFFDTTVGQYVADFIISDEELGGNKIQSGFKQWRRNGKAFLLKLRRKARDSKLRREKKASNSNKGPENSTGSSATSSSGSEVPSGAKTAKAQQDAMKKASKSKFEKWSSRMMKTAGLAGIGGLVYEGLFGEPTSSGSTNYLGLNPDSVASQYTDSIYADTLAGNPTLLTPYPANDSISSDSTKIGNWISFDGNYYNTKEEAEARNQEIKAESPELYERLMDASKNNLQLVNNKQMSWGDYASNMKDQYVMLGGNTSFPVDSSSLYADNSADNTGAGNTGDGNTGLGNYYNEGYLSGNTGLGNTAVQAGNQPTAASAAPVEPPKPLSPYQTILNALGIHTQDDWNKWAKDNGIKGELSEENINELLGDENFRKALAKSDSILGHALSEGYNFGNYKPETPDELSFDFEHGGWGKEDYAAWDGSTDAAWLEAIKEGYIKKGDSPEKIAEGLMKTNAYKRGTEWLQDKDNRLKYLQAILKSEKAPKAAKDYARKWVNDKGWIDENKSGYDEIFGKVRTTHPGTYWKTPNEVANRKSNTLNWVKGEDGVIRAVLGDPDAAWGKPVRTYTWQDKEADNTYNYYEIAKKAEDAAKEGDGKIDWSKYDIRRRPEFGGIFGIAGPIAALSMMSANIGKPKPVNIAPVSPVLTNYQPVGNYLRYDPMNVFAPQVANNAKGLSTERYIRNNTGPLGAQWSAMIANNYAGQLANGDLNQKAYLANAQTRGASTAHNAGIDQYNAKAHDATAQYNASALNEFSKWYATADLQRQMYDAENRANWYNSLYGNIGSLSKALAAWDKENRQYNMIAGMIGNGLFGPVDPKSPMGKEYFKERNNIG